MSELIETQNRSCQIESQFLHIRYILVKLYKKHMW